MTTWTKMKINKMVEIEWANSIKTHVLCRTIYGDMVESVSDLREKLRNNFLLKPIRKIYQDMLDFAEGRSG